MKLERFNDEVFYADERIVRITKQDLDALKILAEKNTRKRVRVCAHKDVNDLVHEMLIVLNKDTYIRPHKHLEKNESFHIVDGVADVVIFDGEGNIADVIAMGDYASGKPFYYRLNAPLYHSLCIHSEFIILHEVTKGPFCKDEVSLAPWAPSEENEREIKEFLAKLEEKMKKR